MSLDFILRYEIDGNELEVFSSNMTHNLNKMADKAGIYYALWRPDEKGYKKASDIIPLLESGLEDLKSRPEYFKTFNAPNGWGMYEDFVLFVEDILASCKQYQNADIIVSR